MRMDDLLCIGWKEWAKLPALHVPLIKVKIDTGAKTSALHVYNLEILKIKSKDYASFIIHPLQKNDIISRKCCCEIVGKKIVKSSNGQKEERYMIRTPIQIGSKVWDINITLTNRDIMHHRMLLGREAMRSIVVNPSKIFCQSRVSSKKAMLVYMQDLVGPALKVMKGNK